MRFPRSIGFVAAAAVLAACNAPNSSGMIGQPATPTNVRAMSKSQHALALPGRFGKFIVPPGTPRAASHRIHHDFVATRPCTYLSVNTTGDVLLYNKDLTQAGDFGSTSYGWGAVASANAIYLGRNDGSGDLDLYTPCTNHPTHTLTGLGDGGAPYGIAIARGTRAVYATDWPSANIEYWPAGSTTATAVTDPNIAEPYFLDADQPGNVWVSGYDTTFSYENLDECTPDFSTCTVQAQIAGGFPGGVQVDQNETVYLNDQFGTLYSYDCSSSTCSQNGSFTYDNGSTVVDYTALALDKYKKHLLWAANIYFCGSTICTNAQSQTVPLNTAVLGAATAGVTSAEALGVARYKPDTP